jgi:Flp pilus assembly protein TadD
LECGQIGDGYGPFDYRTQKHELQIVEGAHFTPQVESLVRGKTTTTAGGDIDYTLRASPNHHRALKAMMDLARKERRDPPNGSRYSVTCWFLRGEAYRPDDAMVKVLHGIFMLRSGKKAEAVEKLEQAAALDGADANIQYNLGLAYFDAGQFDKAVQSAHKAYAAGFPLPGLRDKLKRAGKWRAPQ